MNITIKRMSLYVFGLFFLALGVSFSILGELGVSPVSSLAVAITLSSAITVGITTVLANVLFIIIQVVLNKRIDLRDFVTQLLIAFLFGFFTDLTLFLLKLFPIPETMVVRFIYLIVSLFIMSVGLLCYFTAKLPLMPYDALTYAIKNRFEIKFSQAKVTGDLLSVFVAGAICLTFIKSFGSIGIGTLIAAYFIGKILGWMMWRYQKKLHQWVNRTKEKPSAIEWETSKLDTSGEI